MLKLLAALVAALPLAAQIPDIYKSVDRVAWVVDDVDRVTKAWQQLGLLRIEHHGDFELPVTFRGTATTAKVRMASGFLGNVRVDYIQPLGGSNAFVEYQKKHVSGVFSLVHRVPTLEAFQQEIERLRGVGVTPLQTEERALKGGIAHYAYMDTEPEGKYCLGLLYVPDDVAETSADPESEKIVQFAFTVHDLKPVSAYWAKVGLGAMAFNAGKLHDVKYRGTPIPIEQNFGWQRGRKIVYEWLQPVTSPNVFDDHMKEHGEGIHHLAITVPDMDQAVTEWTRTGLRVASLGAWGQNAAKGSGRFTYVDAEPIGGVTLELLWNYR